MKKHNGTVKHFPSLSHVQKIEATQHFHVYIHIHVSKNENKEELWFLDSQEKLSVCLDL